MSSSKKKEVSALLSCCPSTPLSPSTISSLTSPVKTTVRWAEKRTHRKGVVMVADVENQKKPLISGVEMKKVRAESLEELLRRDAEDDLRKEVKRAGLKAVLQPTPTHSANLSTALHLAVEAGAVRCMAVLLNSKPMKNIMDASNEDGQTPLLLAVIQAHPGLVQQLLDAGADANARNENGYTPLHLLTQQLAKGKRSDDDLLKVTDLLLAHGGVDLEAHATITALAAAAISLPQGDGAPRRGGLLTFCKKLVEHGASLQEATGEGTVEEVLRGKQALTSVLLGERRPAPPRPAPSHFLDLIFANASGFLLESFLNERSKEEAMAAANTRLGMYTVLFRAVEKKNETLVNTLLSHGADPWMVEMNEELPLHRAAALGHKPIFNLLITKMKGDKNKADLRDHTVSIVQKLMENWKREGQALTDSHHDACFSRLLQADVDLDVNQEWNRRTAVQVAADFNRQEAVSKLLQHGAYLGAQPQIMNDRGACSVLTTLLPATLEAAMDGCIRHLPNHQGQTEDEALTNIDFTLLLDYRFLLPPQGAKQESNDISEVETLMNINRSRRHRHVILHPLVQTLLYAKWRKALPFYLLNLALYFFFVIILTAFVYSLKDLRVMEIRAGNPSYVQTNNSTLEQDINQQHTTVNALMAVLLPLTLYMLVREIFQVAFSRAQYLKNIENYLEWFLIVIVIILCCASLSVDATRHLAAWAMIVAWYEFVLILGRAPPLALYITMLRHVSLNFLKFIFLFGALILAFTISFNIILQRSGSGQEDNPEFQDFGSTLPKAIVMATGEFEYSSLSEHFSRDNFASAASAILIFLVFLFLIFLVLMNVMNGLAVTDTKEVVDDATLYSLTSRLELVYLIESLFLRCPPFLKSHMGRLQLLSGTGNSPRLLAKINRLDKKKRLWAGKISEDWLKNNELYLWPSKLDGYTTDCLRTHRQAHLEALEAQELQRRNDSMVRLEDLMRKVVEGNPEVLRQIAAGVTSGHHQK